MKPGELFDEEELKSGIAAELRKVETPALGQTFDLNKLTVDSVLVVNKLVEEITELKAEIERLKIAPPEPPLRLARIGDSYADVREEKRKKTG